ncbi:hypothetical protein PG985_005476 [Apiospora marii]|uniref:uncharacterized protein n=1 Tax=Apiospora marii TaxID=335849 RepID=UPI00312F9024
MQAKGYQNPGVFLLSRQENGMAGKAAGAGGPGEEKCLGAGGDEDKVVEEWEDGVCGECKDREQYKGAKFAEC